MRPSSWRSASAAPATRSGGTSISRADRASAERNRPRAQGCRSGRCAVVGGLGRAPPGFRTKRPRAATAGGWCRCCSTAAGRRWAFASSTRSTWPSWNGGDGRRTRRPARGDRQDRNARPRRSGRALKRQSGRAERVSICVLPFVNMSGDPEQEYFSDGITEDIITDLSKVSALLVIARNTAFTFKGKVDGREGSRAARSASATSSKAACARPATGSGSPPS